MSAEVAAAEERKCIHCSKQLGGRAAAGICSGCRKKNLPDANGKTQKDLWRESAQRSAKKNGADVVKLPRRSSMKPPPKKVAGDGLTALERWRIVVDALRPKGLDADQVLEEFAQEYLDALAKAAEETAEETDP